MYKVIVDYDPWSRMGNRMFQYAAGYIIASMKGSEFYHDGLPNFNIKSHPFTGDRNNLINPLFVRKTYGNHYLNIEELKHHQGDIIIDSYVQKAEYYVDFRSDLIKLFNFKAVNVVPDTDLLMHIRETDANDLNHYLGYDFYKNVIDNTTYDNYHIVTDNSYCDDVQRLVSEGCKLVTEGYVDKFELTCNNRAMIDFSALFAAKNILLSQSSFSWWAAFLNDHEKIIFPYRESINFWPVSPGNDDIDLYFDYKNSCVKYIL